MPRITIQQYNSKRRRWENVQLSKIQCVADSVFVGGEFKIFVDLEKVYHSKTQDSEETAK